MSNAPQTQKPAQNISPSNQNQSKTAPVDVKKDEKTVQSGKDNMKNEGGKNEGGSCATSDTKPTQGGCN